MTWNHDARIWNVPHKCYLISIYHKNATLLRPIHECTTTTPFHAKRSAKTLLHPGQSLTVFGPPLSIHLPNPSPATTNPCIPPLGDIAKLCNFILPSFLRSSSFSFAAIWCPFRHFPFPTILFVLFNATCISSLSQKNFLCVEFFVIILSHEWVDRGQMHQL